MIYFITGQQRIFNEPNIKLTSIDQCLKYFQNKNIIEIDTETEFNTRNPKHLPNPFENKVLSLQLGDAKNQFVIDFQTINIEPLRVLFEDETKLKILANAAFDLKFINYWGFDFKNLYDVFLAECIIYKGIDLPKGFRSLGQMSERYLGIILNKEVREQINWRGLDNTVIKYAANDVAYMTRIMEKQMEIIKDRHLEDYVKFENRYCIAISKTSFKGFKLDSEKWLKVEKRNKIRLIEIEKQLNAYVIDNKLHKFIDYTLFGLECMIKWTSSHKVLPLFKYLGINVEIPDKEKGGIKESVDVKHLKKQIKKFDILPIYIEFKELKKEITTYGENFVIDNINPVTKRIHSEFFQINNTARLSSSNPNLQNIPAEDNNGNTHPLRECFVPEEGNIFIINDFSQQEPRITAEYSNDPYLTDFVLNGSGDSHSLIASIISEYLLGTSIEVSKTNNPMVETFGKPIRAIGKMIGLGLDYGKSAYTLKKDLNISEKEAQKLLDIIADKTPKKIEYFDKCIKFVEHYGYIISDDYFKSRTYFTHFNEYQEVKALPYGRRTKEQNRNYYVFKGKLERFARNNRIQNTGALMTKMAHIYFDDAITKRGWNKKAFVVVSIHDELLVESNKDISKEVSQILKESMIKAGKVFCKTIPMKTDSFIGNIWKH